MGHGIAILGAKVFFILSGLVQQVLLGRILGMGGYGALSTALSACSIVYNPIVQSSIQGVSRVVAQEQNAPERALRRALRVHVWIAIGAALTFLGAAKPLSLVLGAPHLGLTFAVLSAILLLYGIYAPLIGALNGTGRLHLQALFDVLSATLRTLGLVLGAYLGYRASGGTSSGGALGAALGFVASTTLVVTVCSFVAGTGKPGGHEPSFRTYARRLIPLLLGQVLLNVLFQADSLLLRRFAADAALSAQGSELLADRYVGAYRAAQLFSFLPYQLLSSVTLVLFPILARAQMNADKTSIGGYITQGTRLALVLLGAMLSVLIAFPHALVRLVYGAEAATLAGPALAVLGPSLGLLAVLGLITTCLNGLGQERKTFWAMGLAVLSVLTVATLTTRGIPLGSELLVKTAQGTGIGLLLATVLAGWFLYREAGAWVRPLSIFRITAALSLAGGLGRLVEPSRALFVLVYAPVVLAVYAAALALMREVTATDITRLLRAK
jgi:stage V sporulation protein B